MESVFNNKTIKNGGWNRVGICKLLDYGSDIQEALYGQKEESNTATHMATVKTQGDRLNLRAAPDLSAAKVGSIPNGSVVTVLGYSGPEWANVSYGGVVGYAATAYLSTAETGGDEVVITLPRTAAEALLDALTAIVGGG